MNVCSFTDRKQPIMKKIVFLFFAIALFSCDKMNSKKQFFGEWQVLKKEQLNADNTWIDITEECDKDDSESYRNMGDWYFFPGDVKCTESDLPSKGKWNYDADNKRLVYANSTNINVAEATVVSIDGDGMILDMNSAGVTNTTRITYKKAK